MIRAYVICEKGTQDSRSSQNTQGSYIKWIVMDMFEEDQFVFITRLRSVISNKLSIYGVIHLAKTCMYHFDVPFYPPA